MTESTVLSEVDKGLYVGLINREPEFGAVLAKSRRAQLGNRGSDLSNVGLLMQLASQCHVKPSEKPVDLVCTPTLPAGYELSEAELTEQIKRCILEDNEPSTNILSTLLDDKLALLAADPDVPEVKPPVEFAPAAAAKATVVDLHQLRLKTPQFGPSSAPWQPLVLHQPIQLYMPSQSRSVSAGPASAMPLQPQQFQQQLQPALSQQANLSQQSYSLPQSVSGDTSNSYLEMVEQIWRCNDQRASLFLQEQLRTATVGQYESLVAVIIDQMSMLMVHRFGNFLVKHMLDIAQPHQIERFMAQLTGQVASMSKHQFGCHVVQKLIEVSPLIVQACIAKELLDDVLATMCSPYGTHVWQKLLHIPWSTELPALAMLANSAVQRQTNRAGWIELICTEGGCSTIRSFLTLSEYDRHECTLQLLDGFRRLMTHSQFAAGVVCKLAMLSSTRGRTLALIFSKAYEYCKHPVAAEIIIQLLKMKIPSFPTRLTTAITPCRTRLLNDPHALVVLGALDQVKNGNL